MEVPSGTSIFLVIFLNEIVNGIIGLLPFNFR